MKKIILITSLIGSLLTGCVSYKPGEGKIIENRTLGLDLSLPVPMSGGYNIINCRIGWIETKYTHSYKAEVFSNSDQEFNIWEGSGNIKREFGIKLK